MLRYSPPIALRSFDRINRVATIDSAVSVSSRLMEMTFLALGPTAETIFPEIEASVWLSGGSQQILSTDDLELHVESVFLADSTFFFVTSPRPAAAWSD